MYLERSAVSHTSTHSAHLSVLGAGAVPRGPPLKLRRHYYEVALTGRSFAMSWKLCCAGHTLVMPRVPRRLLTLSVREAWEIPTWLGKKEKNQQGEKGDWCSGTIMSSGRESLLFFNVSSTIQNPLLGLPWWRSG